MRLPGVDSDESTAESLRSADGRDPGRSDRTAMAPPPEREAAPAARPCPACGSRTRKELNRFYGTALSVHRVLLVCTRCPWVGFEPTPPRIEQGGR
ncbi:hypothetical protein GCM10022256_31840 [Frondihabitans peucedani]|uniref:Uncharacterized protein n=2 Tax=Frondihabitans peucedani TaxID=598626 RepID=A0ABP8E5Z0_9MICO